MFTYLYICLLLEVNTERLTSEVGGKNKHLSGQEYFGSYLSLYSSSTPFLLTFREMFFKHIIYAISRMPSSGGAQRPPSVLI